MFLQSRLLFLLLFCFLLISIFYYIRFKSPEQTRAEGNSVFVEFSLCLKEAKVLIVPAGSKIREIFNSVNCRMEPINGEIMDERVESGDRIWMDSSGFLHRGRMDAYKLYSLGIKMPLNEVSEDELALIPGIGKELAKRIIQERNASGGFKDFQDLLKVKGIGKAKQEILKKYTLIE